MTHGGTVYPYWQGSPFEGNTSIGMPTSGWPIHGVLSWTK